MRLPFSSSPASQGLEEAKRLTERAMMWVATGYATRYNVPDRTEIVGRVCGAASAYYRPKTRQVVICYELAQAFADKIEHFERLMGARPGSYNPGDEAEEAMRFVIYHELGHAVMIGFGLPVAGNEEIAADEFATVQLIEKPAGRAGIGAMAQMLGFIDFEEKWAGHRGSARALADVHTLATQRKTNLTCWQYGADPATRATYAQVPDSVVDGILPPERRRGCQEEFSRISTAWRGLLASTSLQ